MSRLSDPVELKIGSGLLGHPTPSEDHPTTLVPVKQNRAVNVRDSLRYFIAGNAAGMIGVLVGQPFDTLKVRLQTQRQVESFSPSSTHVPLSSSSSSSSGGTPTINTTTSSGVRFRNFPAPSYYQPPIFSIGPTNGTLYTNAKMMTNHFTSSAATSTSNVASASNLMRVVPTSGMTTAPRQAAPLFTTPMSCFQHTIRSAGVRGLYRGMSSPLLLVGCQKSVAFGVFGTVVQHLQRDAPLPSLSQVCVASLAGGVANSLILTPVDQIKIAMQVQSYGQPVKNVTTEMLINGATINQQPTMRDTARTLIREQGFKNGIYGNFRATLFREIPMYSIYYTLYSYLHRTFVVDHTNRSRWVSNLSVSSAPAPPASWSLTSSQQESLTKLSIGGLTGVGCWAACYPLDVVKSCMVTQTAQNINNKQRKNIRQMIRHIHNTGGISSFYTGLSPALMRAFPVHAVVFFAFATVSEMLENNGL